MATQVSDTNRRTVVIAATGEDLLNLLVSKAKDAGLLDADFSPDSFAISGDEGTGYSLTFVENA